MTATTRWIMRASAGLALLAVPASPLEAQVLPRRAPQPLGSRPWLAPSGRMPVPQPAAPFVRRPAIVGMPTLSGTSNGLPSGSPSLPATHLASHGDLLSDSRILPLGPVAMGGWHPFANLGWEERRHAALRNVRNPFIVNQVLVNPLLPNRLVLDPLNGPGLVAGSWVLPVRPARVDGDGLAEARRPGSPSEESPEFTWNSVAPAIYQPVSGIVTLADGSTFYRGPAGGKAVELGNYSTGGGLDTSLLGGTFYSPTLGSLGNMDRSTAFLPYVW